MIFNGLSFFVPFITQPAIVPASFSGDEEEIDEKVLRRIIPQIPIWVKNPDYDRVILL